MFNIMYSINQFINYLTSPAFRYHIALYLTLKTYTFANNYDLDKKKLSRELKCPYFFYSRVTYLKYIYIYAFVQMYSPSTIGTLKHKKTLCLFLGTNMNCECVLLP